METTIDVPSGMNTRKLPRLKEKSPGRDPTPTFPSRKRIPPTTSSINPATITNLPIDSMLEDLRAGDLLQPLSLDAHTRTASQLFLAGSVE
jgi:hypothetical protein